MLFQKSNPRDQRNCEQHLCEYSILCYQLAFKKALNHFIKNIFFALSEFINSSKFISKTA